MNKEKYDVVKLQRELDITRIQLAACGVAAQCNTRGSRAKQRVSSDSPYWSSSYEMVCQAVDREIKYRESLEQIKDACDNTL